MNPEQEANNLLSDFGIYDLPICPFSISKKLGIQVRHVNLESIDGGIFSIKGNVGVLLNENVKSPSRLRFTLAHEIGHYVMDINNDPSLLCQNVELDLDGNSCPTIERRADRFAASLLIPDFRIIKGYVGQDPSWNNVKLIAESCKVSLQSAAFRYTETNSHNIYFVYLKDGLVKWFKKSANCEFTIPIRYKPKDIPKSGQNDWDEVAATKWFHDCGAIFNRSILEWALPVTSDGFQLVMLWDEEDLIEDDENEDE